MKSPQQFRAWWTRRGALALLIMLITLLWILRVWLDKPQPRIVHTLGSSTQHAQVLWSMQEIFTQITSNDNGEIYAMPIARDNLIAIDTGDGTAIWKIELPLERGGGARRLLADQSTVFVATSLFIDAYEITTGELKWSTGLGDGHVSVIPQLDSSILRVYYGDKLIELDPKTGNMLTTIPKGSVTWVSGNVVLQTARTNRLTALDKQSGELLWTNDRLFYVDEGQEPLDIGDDKLLVGFITGICTLNLRTGEYSWCRPEIDITKLAIDYQSQLGFAMRDDLVLLTIDLQTGNILGETSFLSSVPIDGQMGYLSFIAFSAGVVIVSFSDSGQTFGLEFK